MTACGNTSSLLEKIGEEKVRYVVNLKVKGTINSYDMLIIRNQMISLRNLDLTEASIVDCDYLYSNSEGTNYHSVKDEITGDWLQGLMSVKLPATTKIIGNRAFYNCSRLSHVTIPDGVTSIGVNAFYGCDRMQDLSLPQSVTSFGSYAFYNCTGLKEVDIPEGVTDIASYAFYKSTDLESVTIPASVKTIGEYAFWVSKPLSLHISSLDSWLDVRKGGYSNYVAPFMNVAKLYVGESTAPVEEVTIPAGTSTINKYTFTGFNCLKSIAFPEELITIESGAFSRCSELTEIILPKNLQTIGESSFYECSNLESVAFGDSLKTIQDYAFSGCTKLANVEQSAYLKTIGSYAFQGCSNLAELLIPASMTEIHDYAFEGCSNLNRVIATTVEPIRINENTFSTYRSATLLSPKTSYYKYYWNTQYNQFLARKEYDQDFSYKYFYIKGCNGDNMEDFELDDTTGGIHGTTDEETGEETAPDADFYEGAGFIVRESVVQELGDVHIHSNGNNGASVIAMGAAKVHIDNLYVDIKVQKNRWYFFCFPFEIQRSEVKFRGSHVWYLYDGATRALNGNGGWKAVANDGVMQAGRGYIFQGAVNATLSIHVSDLTIDASDVKTNMIVYQSENKNDASWNLIGNSNVAYYGLENLSYDAPITIYDNETGNYEAIRPGDDEYEFYPFQAFFVQKPEGVETLDFDASKKETKNMADKKAAHAAARGNAPKQANVSRQVVNLVITSDVVEADSVAAPSDRTRIVVNPTKSLSYETDCDAAKFMADNLPQIYSRDDEGCNYAINERPLDDGLVKLAVKTPKAGSYTISAARLDCSAKLRDLQEGIVVDLSESDYTFAAEATTYTQRFELLLADRTEGIEAVEEAVEAIEIEAGAIVVNQANADVKVYALNGALVAVQQGAGRIEVPAGVYVVNVNGQSVKVTVTE